MKQAVVLIHGIGEQVPMDTLRGFVAAVWTTDPSLRRPKVPAQAWSKPDRISGDLELRRLTTAENREGKRTDFFEFYWAHLMQGTRLSQIGAWLKVLLLRRPSRVPAQLRGIWWTLVVLLALVAAAYACQTFGLFEIPAWLLGVAGLVWSVILWFLIHYAGDAARYLHVAPPNIAGRQQVRQQGIALLEKLHASSAYDRILVVGHSLGSVIGYDILTHLWTRYHDAHAAAGKAPPPCPKLQALEALARSGASLEPETYQAAQSECLEELQGQGSQWRVTDFVTLGSPLAHAPVLLARHEAEFAQKKLEREFPTCPPVFEEIEGQQRFSFEKHKRWVPHHAAVFAPTRWTNLYFPCRATLWGDVIGGPLAGAFGRGVRDIPVTTDLWNGMLSHTRYWALPAGSGAAPSWIQRLRQALRLCVSPPKTGGATP